MGIKWKELIGTSPVSYDRGDYGKILRFHWVREYEDDKLNKTEKKVNILRTELANLKINADVSIERRCKGVVNDRKMYEIRIIVHLKK